MNREVTNIIHDTLRGMLDKKKKAKIKKEELKVDWETFSLFSTV